MIFLWLFLGSVAIHILVGLAVARDIRQHPTRRKWPYNSRLYCTVRDIKKSSPIRRG